jgi:DNA-binding NarL/FixJ family response regulator
MRRKAAAVVVEGLPVFREAMLRMLRHDLGVEMVQAVADVAHALKLIEAAHPCLAVIDRDLPGPDALEAVSLARELSPETRVVLLSALLTDADIVRAMKVGVRGYALKSDAVYELRRVVKGVLAGQVVFSQKVRERLVARGGPNYAGAEVTGRIAELTGREIEILACIGQGLSVKEVAALLNVSPKTVDGHKTSLMAKLDIHDRVLLAHYAVREGLVSLWTGDRTGEHTPATARDRKCPNAVALRGHPSRRR